MTIDEFIDNLRATPRGWYFMGSKLRITIDGESCCPLTAVAMFKFDRVYRVDQAIEATIDIGLEELEGKKIIDAADGYTGAFAVDGVLNCRNRLVAACGLTE